MLLYIALLVAGLLLVVFGAEYMVDGASSIARRFGLSEFVIGLTIVGIGTSAPEMVVSFIGAIQGNGDISLGNIVGSNIFNTLLILGLTALILPMDVTPSNRKRDIPMNLAVTLLLILLGLNYTIFGLGIDGLSRPDGGLLLLIFLVYMIFSFNRGKDSKATEETDSGGPSRPLWLAAIMVLGGLAALVFGGNLFVDNATNIARGLGVSDKFIAITILAGGTSLPELATCVAAAVKKKGQLALGNIIGSNISNIILILGGSALINPISFSSITPVDVLALVISALALIISCFFARRNVIDRWDGTLFVLLWLAYMAYLVINL